MAKNRWSATTPKEVAKSILEELGVCRPYVMDFENNGAVHLFDKGEARRINPNSVLGRKLRAIEKKSKVKVYAVIHSDIYLVGNNYAFLCVSPYPEDWNYCLQCYGLNFHAYSYVWNTIRDRCSEFGSVVLNTAFGMLRRVG